LGTDSGIRKHVNSTLSFVLVELLSIIVPVNVLCPDYVLYVIGLIALFPLFIAAANSASMSPQYTGFWRKKRVVISFLLGGVCVLGVFEDGYVAGRADWFLYGGGLFLLACGCKYSVPMSRGNTIFYAANISIFILAIVVFFVDYGNNALLILLFLWAVVTFYALWFLFADQILPPNGVGL